MALTQEHLQALELALAKGERRVTFGDKTVEYRSVDELKDAIREVKRNLNNADPSAPAVKRQLRIHTHKGL
jgi:isopropylmalate/homocitrate/citramalate synthase